MKINGFAHAMTVLSKVHSSEKYFFESRKNRMYGYRICYEGLVLEGISAVAAVASPGSGAQLTYTCTVGKPGFGWILMNGHTSTINLGFGAQIHGFSLIFRISHLRARLWTSVTFFLFRV